MKSIGELIERALEYAMNYPGVRDMETREAIFESHLAYLIDLN